MFRESGFDLFITELLSDRVRRTWTVCAGRLSRKLISDPKYATYLLRGGQDSRFLLTIARIMIAYRSRAMEYGLFVARKRPSL